MRTTSDRQRRLLEVPVSRALIELALPMALGVTAVLLFNVVDTFWVGQLGAAELAAMGFTFPVVMVVSNLTIGLSIGATAVIARAFGEGRGEKARRLTTDALGLALLVVVAVAATGYATIDPLFSALGADRATVSLIREYMELWYLGVGLLVVPMVGNGAIRATGDMKTPAYVMMASGLVNAVLDPLFIFGWGPVEGMGLRGAALATIASWVISLSVALYVLAERERLLSFERPAIGEVARSWREILHIGLPAAGTNLLTPLAAGVVTRIVSDQGAEAVAAYGVGTRVEGLSMIGVFALTAAITTFVGHNLGARNGERVRETLRFCGRAALVWGGGAALLLAALADPIARLFSDDAEVIAQTKLYLRIVPASYAPFGFTLLVASMFNASGQPLKATALAGLRLVVLAVPLAWLGAELFGLAGIFSGVACANLVGGLAAWFYGRAAIGALTDELQPREPRPAE